MKRFTFSPRSLFIIHGPTRLEFLDGLSTNRISELETGHVMETVFTDANARIIDLAMVGQMEDAAFLVGHSSNRTRLFTHLQSRSVIAGVEVVDASELNHFIQITEPHVGMEFALTSEGTRIADGPFSLLISSVSTNLEAFLSGMQEDSLELDRIKAMRPGPPELTAAFTPYNLGLDDLVHQAKGCYLGQEVLARMVSRGRFGKRLVLLEDVAEETVEGLTSFEAGHALAVQRITRTP